MSPPPGSSLFKRVVWRSYWILAVAGGIYAVILGLLMNPIIQRNALYAHRIQSQWLNNVSEPMHTGFAKNQVTPFTIPAPDAALLYCWHILPLTIYVHHAEHLSTLPTQPLTSDFTSTFAYSLLSGDPESRLVINYHGNAGHVAQGWRTQTYHQLTALPKTHVITCDYRGFGLSPGSPTEAGLITDSIAIANYALYDLAQPADRIVLLGQSLGTATATATTLYFLDPSLLTSPRKTPESTNTVTPSTRLFPSGALAPSSAPTLPTTFASTILVAPFTSLPSLLLTYRIFGILPILRPLRIYPKFLRFINTYIVDTWPTLARWVAAFQLAEQSDSRLDLRILHARNDMDISWNQSEDLYYGITSSLQPKHVETGPSFRKVSEDLPSLGAEGVRRGAWAYRSVVMGRAGSERSVELEITRTGGHNRIVAGAPVALAVHKGFQAAKGRG